MGRRRCTSVILRPPHQHHRGQPAYPTAAHTFFAATGRELPFPVICDARGDIAAKLGVVSFPARVALRARSAFVVDGSSYVRAIVHFAGAREFDVPELTVVARSLQQAERAGDSHPVPGAPRLV